MMSLYSTNFDSNSSSCEIVACKFLWISANPPSNPFTSVGDKPWTAELGMAKEKGPVYEFACNEGNYALANTLHGARVAEVEAAKK